jgi:hypothetical protein
MSVWEDPKDRTKREEPGSLWRRRVGERSEIEGRYDCVQLQSRPRSEVVGAPEGLGGGANRATTD